MDPILALARKRCEQAEVFRVWRKETPVRFEGSHLKLLETSESSGVALRLVKDGRTGFSATNDPGDIEGLVERALEVAPFGAPAKFELPGPAEHPHVSAYAEATERVSIDDMVALGQGIIDAVRRHSPDVVCEGGVGKGVATVEIANTNGGNAQYRQSSFSAGIRGTLIRGTDMLFVGHGEASCTPDIDPKVLTSRIIEQLELGKHVAPAPTGQVPVVFTVRAIAHSILFPLLTALNGRTVLQGASPLQGKLGKRLVDERISIWDDATAPMRVGSRSMDDEGVPSRRLPLFERGAPVSFLYDLQTAGLAGAKSTGSASRSLGSLPAPATSVLFIAPGDTPYKDIISGIKDGLVVEQLLGAGQSNILGGDFGGNVLLGYRIQNGQITGRVKDTMITANVYEALSKIVAISDKAEWVGGDLCTPAICCQGVTVSTKS